MKPKGWIYVVAIIALIGLGAELFRGVSPDILLASEPIFNIGPWAVRNTVFTSWVVIVLMVAGSFLATRKLDLVPVRFAQNFIEAILEWMYGIVEDAAGPANAARFFPLVATIFIYIVCSSWLGLVPVFNTIGRVAPPDVGATTTASAVVLRTYHLGPLPIAVEPLRPLSVEVKGTPNGDLIQANGQPLPGGPTTVGTVVPYFRSVFSDANAPLSIALVSFVVVEYWGISALGLGTYLSKFFNFKALLHGQPLGFIDVFVGLLELLSEFVRIISFTFRLLGNIFAGEVLVIYMTFLVPFIVPTLFYGLELFDGFIQAAIFALLTLIFGIMAVEHHESGEHEGPGHEKVEVELEPA